MYAVYGIMYEHITRLKFSFSCREKLWVYYYFKMFCLENEKWLE